jgi:FkbH-like protein
VLRDRVPELEYGKLVAISRRLVDSAEKAHLKLAILSDAATQQFIPILRAILDSNGFFAEIYEGAFDAIEIETYNPGSKLYSFDPDAVVLLNSSQALRASFARRGGSAVEFVAETLKKITGVWTAIRTHSRASVVQSTFALPLERVFGNFDLKVPDSLYSVALALNSGIAEAARQQPGVLLHDVEGVASMVGRAHFFDDRFWDMWKTFCSLEFLPHVAQNLVDVLMALHGRGVKCVVLDLDNTLWGGVIGDDGLEGIRLTAHGDGEAWYRLQLFLRELQRRGILLAVCSKNDEKNALLPFESHPEMVLRREDISVFIANWNNKADNIRKIREILNIGFDSMVFLDDNPFERNLVRDLVPEVIVPELPEDPSDYVRCLADLNLFETAVFSDEDLRRSEMYKLEAERRSVAASFASVEEYLESLDMRIAVSRFDRFHLPRIAQLIQRSNQFNLTTRRRSEAECEALMHDSTVLPLYVNLSDRLGDHGLISVVILQTIGWDLHITDWLMSCRVLARGVEQYAMNQVFAFASQMGISRVIGQYIPTAKNGMVRDFFQEFGFTRISEEHGQSDWQMCVKAYRPAKVFLKAVEEGIPVLSFSMTAPGE